MVLLSCSPSCLSGSILVVILGNVVAGNLMKDTLKLESGILGPGPSSGTNPDDPG